MISDESGQTSTKRVIAFIGVLVLCATLVLNTIYPNAVKPSDTLVYSIEGIVMVCIASSSVDKFSKTVRNTNTPTTNNLYNNNDILS